MNGGAVAYLTQSGCGRSNTEVTINSSSSYYTGGTNTIATIYGSNVNQSSTGNATGIYDLSGGAWEYVAGYITNADSYISSFGSSFANTTDYTDPDVEEISTKYVTAYPYTNITEATNRTDFRTNFKTTRYGDAILETGSMAHTTGAWFSDYSSFPYSSYPFFERGGYVDNNTGAGVFAFGSWEGDATEMVSWRVVLVP